MSHKKNTLFVVGLNHETAPVSVRERFSFAIENLSDALKDLIDIPGVSEAVIVSTCNRMEIYCCAESEKIVFEWIARNHQVTSSELQPYLYLREGVNGLRHLSRVASGLDSMVIGETQILGQCKQAFNYAKAARSVGPYLHRLFDTALSIAKDVRTQTGVGAHSVSLASVALRTCDRIFPNLSLRSVLFVGAGEMIRLCSDYFSQRNFKSIAYTNRSSDNAKLLAEKYGGTSFALERIGSRLPDFDVIISCTGSVVPIIGKGVVQSALKKRRHAPILMFDLAVPRDIEEAVGSLDDVFLFSIDDLGALVQNGMESRSAAVSAAEGVIENRLPEFGSWVKSRESISILRAFRENGEKIAELELSRALSNLKKGDDPEKILYALAHAIKNKYLDAPSRALAVSSADDAELLASILVRLFNLEGLKK